MHCVGGQRGGTTSFCSGVGLLRFSNPRLVSVIFTAPSLLEMKFFQKLLPLVTTAEIYKALTDKNS